MNDARPAREFLDAQPTVGSERIALDSVKALAPFFSHLQFERIQGNDPPLGLAWDW